MDPLLPILISATLFMIIYVYYSTKKTLIKTGNLPQSISGTFYVVPVWLFVAFLLYSCGSISIINLTLKKDEFIWSNLGAWLLAIVGFMSNIKVKIVLLLHTIGATLGFVIILAGFWIDYHLPALTITSLSLMTLVGYVLKSKGKPYSVWVVELVAIVFMNIGYYIVVLGQ